MYVSSSRFLLLHAKVCAVTFPLGAAAPHHYASEERHALTQHCTKKSMSP